MEHTLGGRRRVWIQPGECKILSAPPKVQPEEQFVLVAL